ncbi:MAG: vanadium-dependent haloperoxidase [Acidobacteriota bacterium]
MSEETSLSRRRFLGGVGTVAAAAAAGLTGPAALEAQLPDAAEPARKGAKPSARRERMYQIRNNAAKLNRDMPEAVHKSNGDETRYPNHLGNFSKGLDHNEFGEVDLDSYAALLHAVGTGDPDDFEAIPQGGGRRFINPQAGLSFDLEGVDAQTYTAPPAPALASAQAAGEITELYWMAELRDVKLDEFAGSADAAAACADLNRLSDFRGLRKRGLVAPETLFRDPLPGCAKGPYLSQFLWMDAPLGAENVERRINTRLPGIDYLTDYDDWLNAQKGNAISFAPKAPVRRYVQTIRDLSTWVHMDVLFQAYFSASLILGAPPEPFDASGAGLGCPANAGSPYYKSSNQYGFVTFGDPYRKTLLCEVATRALKATWYQKWFVHRRLRPEAFAGRVHNQVVHNRYPGILHKDVLDSPVLDRLYSKNGTYLLPMAYVEGSPLHPSYTAGHATVAGACVTILKAVFDESFVISRPVIPTADGLDLDHSSYDGPELTVGGELNKLASNVATGRNMAGAHWRTDAMESLKLGEAIAISLLRDQRGLYNERFDGFTFTKFDGTKITI